MKNADIFCVYQNKIAVLSRSKTNAKHNIYLICANTIGAL